jgi:hypothetical protein
MDQDPGMMGELPDANRTKSAYQAESNPPADKNEGRRNEPEFEFAGVGLRFKR